MAYSSRTGRVFSHWRYALKRIAPRRCTATFLSIVVSVSCATAPAAAQPCFSWASGFGAPPANGANGVVRAMVVFDEDGWGPNPPSLFVGGSFTSVGGVSVHGLARWDGTAWHDVGGGVTGDTASVYALAVVDLDGSGPGAPALFVGGDFAMAGAVPANNIARWNGAAWAALGTGTAGNFGLVRALAAFPTDPTGARLYAGGDFTSAGGVTLNFIARWNGTTWSDLNGTVGTSGGVFALLPFGGGLYVGGAFPSAGVAPNTQFIARWSGTAWSALASGLSSNVYALTAWDADGPGPGAAVIAVGGAFTTTAGGGTTLNRVATWNGTTWSAVGSGLVGGGSTGVRALSAFDDECGHSLYAGGDYFNGAGISYVGRWSGTIWRSLGLGTISAVRALAPFAGPPPTGRIALYAGGDFTAAGGMPSSNFGQWIGADTDGDGLYDCWEAVGQGIDINCDGMIDLDLHALGAFLDHKDVFVEVDSMAGMTPMPGAVADVILAFSMAPVPNPDTSTGIILHVDIDDTIGPSVAWTIDDTDGDGIPDWPTEFDAAKATFFGTATQRGDANAVNILAAKRLAYRYCICARSFDGGSSGLSEIGGNDFMTTLGAGGWGGGTRNDQAGTFMHELGHTLGLYHGGNQIDANNDRRYNYKPNYHSVMNYTWQTPATSIAVGWTLDYSRSAWPDLVETGIFEGAGMGGNPLKRVPVGAYFDLIPDPPVFIPPHNTREGGPVRLNSDADAGDTFAYDINHIDPTDPASPGDTLHGHNDWPALDYNFRDSGDFGDGAHHTANVLRELDWSTRAMLDALPLLPPCPADIVANNTVDVDDLLAVITHWGRCPAPCPPQCTGDIAPSGPPQGNCTVDVNDLLAVITSWGACP